MSSHRGSVVANLRSMRMQVQSLGLAQWVKDVALLWLAAAARIGLLSPRTSTCCSSGSIQSLAREFPNAAGATIK